MGEGDRALRRPAPAAAAEAVEAHLAAGAAVALVGECVVETDDADGATTATRHLLVKPDGVVVVHGRTGAAAERRVDGGDVTASVVDGRLRIRAGDDLRVDVTDIAHLVAADLDEPAAGAGREAAAGDHAAIRDRLLAEPDLVEPGFRPLATERETPAGPVDLYGRDESGRAVAVEVKARRAGPAAVGQLDRYVAALGTDLHAGAEVRGVLVAPSATERTRALLGERGYGFSAVAADR